MGAAENKIFFFQGLFFEKGIFPLNFSFFEVKDNGGAYTFMAGGKMRQLFPNISSEYPGALFQRVELSEYPARGLKMVCFGARILLLK